MSAALVLDIMRHAVTVALMTSAPMLVTALVVGILVSFAQAITQVQEQTLTFVPKFVAIAIVGLLAAPWLIRTLVAFLTEILRSLPALVGQ